MPTSISSTPRASRVKRYAITLAAAWTLVIAAMLLLYVRGERRNVRETAHTQASEAFEKDLVYRRWAAGHGGVYAPRTEQTPPNPYLAHVEERDIETPSGRALTLINPAYMTRQVHDLEREQRHLQGHITSLNPLRPENAPDPWEAEALRAIEQGESEVASLELLDGQQHLRLMRPLFTEERCLKCHAPQGYELGDLRGGISVSVPMPLLWAGAYSHITWVSLGCGLIWLLGLGGIGFGARRLGQHAHARDQAEEALHAASEQWQRSFDALTDDVCILDGSGVIQRANRAMQDRFEPLHGNLTGLDYRLVYCGTANPDPAPPCAAVLSGSGPVTIETQLPTLAGHYLVSSFPLADKAGGLAGAVSVVKDITARKRAEETLRQSEERYRLLADNTDDVVSLNAADGERLYVSPSIERLTGWSSAEALTMDWRTLIHTDDLPAVEQARAANLRGERTTVEYRLRCRNGEFIWLELKATPLRGPTGEVQKILCASRDVTERRRAETALLRERRLFIGGPTVVFRWVAAEGWPVEYVSPNVEGVFGYSTEDFVSGRVLFASVIHPDDLERIGDEVTRHSHAGVPFFEQEYRIVRPDGEVRWVYDFTVVARDEGGTITHYEGYVLDATDRKSAEASLRDSERRYRTMVQQSPLSIVIYEPDGTPRVANPAFRKLWGVSEQDYQFLLANYNVLEDEALEDLGITAYLRRAFRGEPVVIPEELYDPADSTVASQTGLAARRIRAYAYPVTDEDAQIREVVLIHEDVTAQRQAEADQARLATAIDQAAEAVVVTNAGGAIQYVNPAFERITGYSREEAIGQNPRILKSGEHDESFYKEMWDTLRRGDAWSGQIVNKRRDGTLYTEDAVISPVRNTAGLIQNFVAVKRDVTREVQLEEQLRESQRLDAIGQLAGGVAHDFNNILTAILGNVELSLDELRAQVPPAAGLIGALEQIEESAQRASRITQQLLTFGRRQTIQSEVINLSRVLADLESMLRRLIPESVALEVGSAAELDAVRADSGQIEQVIVNLVLNAADAMPQGGQLTIAARNVELSGDDAGAHLDARPGR